MKIFITGATGFIGQYAVKKLAAKDHDILLYVRDAKKAKKIFGSAKNIRLAEGELRDSRRLAAVIKKFRPEAALHLAWEGIPNFDAETSAKNLEYSLSLVRTLADSNCKAFIGAGTCWEYGREEGKMREDMLPAKLNPLIAAKHALFVLGTAIAQSKNMKFFWPRLFFVYGPGQREGSLIPSLIREAEQGRTPEPKNPKAANDFIYVGDVAEGLAALVRKYKTAPAGAYNLGSGKLTEVAEVAGHVAEEYGLAVKSRKKIKANGFFADIQKSKKVLGWTPKTDIRKGVAKTAEYAKAK